MSDGREVEFYQYQTEFRDSLMYALMTREYNEIGYEVSRQAGKTTGVAEPVAFLASVADILFCVGARPFAVGFFAPREDQYRTDWLRLREILPDIAALFGLVPMEDNDTLIRYGRPKYNRYGQCTRTVPRIEIHGHSLGEGTKVESLTLDLAIIEEAQDIDDDRIDKMVRPMLTSTNGVIAHVGVAGYRKCYFKKLIDEGEHNIVWPYDKVLEVRRAAYERTGNDYHLGYERFIEKELNRIGKQITDAFRTQYKLEWITEVGNFISERELHTMRRDGIKPRSKYVRVGVDFGKAHDFTVVTITTELGQRLASWRMNGTDYTEQIPLFLAWVQEYCDTHFYSYVGPKGEEVNEPLEVEWLQYDHTGVGNATGEMLDRQCVWVVRPVDFTGKNKADMFQDWLNMMAVSTGLSKGVITDEGQRRFEYDSSDENVGIFEAEATDAEKSHKDNGYLVVAAPEKKDKHDDTLFSYVLSSYEGDGEPSLGYTAV